MKKARDLVRGGKPLPTDGGEPVPIGRRRGGRGAGGGLPENPEARTAADFAPGGSAGPSADVKKVRRGV